MMPAVERGAIRAFFLYDVADTIDLSKAHEALGGRGSRAPLQLRPKAASPFTQFASPPIAVTLSQTFAAKIFDYGVISLSFVLPFSGSWDRFGEATRNLRRDDSLVAASREELGRLLEDLRDALDDPRAPLFEDYFIFEVERFAEPVSASELVSVHRSEVANLVTCEDRALAAKEIDDALRVSFSYYEDDLAVIEWENAFVYDANPGPLADILEFANSQLVDLRTYDAILDAELDRIYKSKPPPPIQRMLGRGSAARAEEIRFLIVDVRELLDRSGNALKFIGDAYFARLYRGAAARLGVEEWQRQIDVKLRAVSEMYRFAQDRAEHARADLLEIVIILLIVIEVVVGVIALRHP